MLKIIQNNYKSILQAIGLFIFSVAIAILFEDNYRQLIRFLFKLFQGNQIVFIGKNIHLFPSFVFVYAFGLFPILALIILKRNIFYNELKAVFYLTISFFSTTFLITYFESYTLIIECTACNDGIRRLAYNQINYDLYFIISLFVSLLTLCLMVFRHYKRFDNLIGFWTSYNDGSGLYYIFGWSLNFNEDKTGQYKYWGSGLESDLMENIEFDFEWERLDKNSIKIKTSTDENWTSLNYKIIEVKGAYKLKQFQLKEKDKNEFWNSPEPLYRKKYRLLQEYQTKNY